MNYRCYLWHCVPLGQEIFKFEQVKNEMFLPTGQVDLNFFLPCFNHIQVLTDTYLLTYLLTYLWQYKPTLFSTFFHISFSTANKLHLNMEGLSVSPPKNQGMYIFLNSIV